MLSRELGIVIRVEKIGDTFHFLTKSLEHHLIDFSKITKKYCASPSSSG